MKDGEVAIIIKVPMPIRELVEVLEAAENFRDDVVVLEASMNEVRLGKPDDE